MLDQIAVAKLRAQDEGVFQSMIASKEAALIKHYVQPHGNTSRQVFQEDIFTLNTDAEIMYKLLFCRYGKNRGAYAIAHSQINTLTPLRFFVTPRNIIINPVIENHTKHQHLREEGCMSFPDKPKTRVLRYNKLTVSYQTIIKDEKGGLMLSDRLHTSLNGIDAEIWQHEIDHMDGKYIYPLS